MIFKVLKSRECDRVDFLVRNDRSDMNIKYVDKTFPNIIDVWYVLEVEVCMNKEHFTILTAIETGQHKLTSNYVYYNQIYIHTSECGWWK